MRRMAAISKTLCGAQRIWVGSVELGPGLVSAAHHHGEAKSAIYIISGETRFYSGKELAVTCQAGRLAFIWLAPAAGHITINCHQLEPVCLSVAHSPQ